MTNEELLAELRNRFPGIDDADADMNGGDCVENLVQWFFELGGEQIESGDDEGDED